MIVDECAEGLVIPVGPVALIEPTRTGHVWSVAEPVTYQSVLILDAFNVKRMKINECARPPYSRFDMITSQGRELSQDPSGEVTAYTLKTHSDEASSLYRI